MKNTLLMRSNFLFTLLLISIKCIAQPNYNQKQSTAPDLYQEAIKSHKENVQFTESNQFKFDTAAVKQKEIDFSQNNAQTFLKLHLLKEQQSGDTTKRFGVKISEEDIPRK